MTPPFADYFQVIKVRQEIARSQTEKRAGPTLKVRTARASYPLS